MIGDRRVAFVFGIAVGIAATLASQGVLKDAGPAGERTPDSPEQAVADQPRTLRPVIAPLASEPAPVQSQAPSTTSLAEALAQANGDVESLVIVDDTFIGGRASQLLSGDEFARFVLALSRTASVGAAENYQRLFDQYNALPSVRSGAVTVQSLACGRRVCTASLVGYDSASVETAWAELTGNPGMGMLMDNTGFEIATGRGGMIGGLRTQGPNGYERRLLITVDPSIRSATTGFQATILPGG